MIAGLVGAPNIDQRKARKKVRLIGISLSSLGADAVIDLHVKSFRFEKVKYINNCNAVAMTA
jgi:hypothetical protein